MFKFASEENMLVLKIANIIDQSKDAQADLDP